MANTTLRNGSTGSDVKKLQQTLIEAGYNVGSTGADGVYGKNTAAAVKQYQKDNGLAVDGIAGKNTLGSLYAAPATTTVTNKNKVAGGSDPDVTPSGKPVLKSNKVGEGTAKSDPDVAATSVAPASTGFSYADFSYGSYTPSDTVNQANALLEQQKANKPGAYQSQWQGQIDEAFDAYTNRDPFSYDFNADALYQQYRDNYIQQGQMAMMDTMGQAAAMTGGYGNSYAQSVGQQVYNQQLNQLNDIIPELYQMALDRYDKEGTNLYNQYNMLLARENKDYERYQNDLNNYYNELEYLTNRYDTERNLDYSQWETDRQQAYNDYNTGRQEAYSDYITEQEREYQDKVTQENREWQEKQTLSDREWDEYLANKDKEAAAAEMMAGMGDFDRLGDVYGLTDEEVQKLVNAYTAANTPKSGGTKQNQYKTLTEADKDNLIKRFSSEESQNGMAQVAAIFGAGYDPSEIDQLMRYANPGVYYGDQEQINTDLEEEKKKQGVGGSGGGVYYSRIK